MRQSLGINQEIARTDLHGRNDDHRRPSWKDPTAAGGGTRVATAASGFGLCIAFAVRAIRLVRGRVAG